MVAKSQAERPNNRQPQRVPSLKAQFDFGSASINAPQKTERPGPCGTRLSVVDCLTLRLDYAAA
jgi:hypothetical protein